MYKILHKLFGWDYIHWKDAINAFGIARIHTDAEGNPYFWKYKNINCLVCLKDTYHRIVWLTCKREKYLGDEVDE